ncbi:MAG: A24 family peptidase [Bacillota bacterium]|nr:A24 family peptidase [Bacillota bacterium]
MDSAELFFFLLVFFAGLAAGRFINVLLVPGRGGKRGSFSFPIVEIISAGIFLNCFYFFGFSPLFFKFIFIFSLLLLISCIDLKTGLIPNRITLFLFLWIFFWQLFYPYLSPESAALGFLAGGGLFYLIALLSRGGMGGGDVKLMAVLGLAAGWPYMLLVFLLSFVMGAVAGLGLLVFGKKTRKDPLAFAPYLSLALWFATFWGLKIWQWYISFL